MNGAIVEIDICKYFNTIPHNELMAVLEKKISDQRFLRLIKILITVPIINGKQVEINTRGCQQGSIISPILSNIYLHHVIDEWFENIRHSHIHGRAELIRYADDMVFTFERFDEANRFYRTLPKRLAKYGLELHSDKSQVMPAGLGAAQKVHKQGKRMPTFNFLGFTCYWGKARKGFWRLKFTSRRDRFTAKLKGLRKFLWEHLNTDTKKVLKITMQVIRGWINYYNISDNGRKIDAFRRHSARIIFKWLNRKGRRHPMSWDHFNQILSANNFPHAGKTISMFQIH